MKTSDVQVYFGIFRYQGKDIIYKDQVKNHIKLWIAILRKWTCETIENPNVVNSKKVPVLLGSKLQFKKTVLISSLKFVKIA